MSQPLATSAYVRRMLGALCVIWWTCLKRMLVLTNCVMKKPTLFQWTWNDETHIKEEVKEEGKKTKQSKKMGIRSKIYKKWLWIWTMYCKHKKNQKDTKSTVMIENADWKKRKRMNKRTKETTEAEATEDRRDLGDIFSSSLVRDVLYSAGWSLRWGPLEIIMTACCFRQPHTFHWKTINKLPHFSQALM